LAEILSRRALNSDFFNCNAWRSASGDWFRIGFGLHE
jgi:hypothetical protein